MNLLDALQPLRRKLPLLITSLLFVVVAVASWSAYQQLERALLLATGDRVSGAAERLASILDEQTARLRQDEQRIAALPAVVRYATDPRPADRDTALALLARERAPGSAGRVSVTLLDATGHVLLTRGAARPAPTVPPRYAGAATRDALHRG